MGIAPAVAAARRSESDDEFVVPITSMTVLSALVIGGVSTMITAPWLAHHLRWHRPAGDLARTSRGAELARADVRRHRRALAIEGGVALAGALAIGAGALAAFRCPDRSDAHCTGTRYAAGAVPGVVLLTGASIAAVSTGVLLLLHRRHGHTGPRPPAVSGKTRRRRDPGD